MVKIGVHIRKITSNTLEFVVVVRQIIVKTINDFFELANVRQIKMCNISVLKDKIKATSSSIKQFLIRVRGVRGDRSILQKAFILKKGIRVGDRYLVGGRVVVEAIIVLLSIVFFPGLQNPLSASGNSGIAIIFSIRFAKRTIIVYRSTETERTGILVKGGNNKVREIPLKFLHGVCRR